MPATTSARVGHGHVWLRSRFVVRRLKPLDQLGRVNAEPSRQLEQVVQVQVALTSLHLPEERPMNTGLIGQGFLAETQSFAACADAFAKYSSCGGQWFGHSAANDIRPDCLCTEQLCPMRIRPDTVQPHVCVGRIELLRWQAFAESGVYSERCDRPRSG